jgi:hypothetical protein
LIRVLGCPFLWVSLTHIYLWRPEGGGRGGGSAGLLSPATSSHAGERESCSLYHGPNQTGGLAEGGGEGGWLSGLPTGGGGGLNIEIWKCFINHRNNLQHIHRVLIVLYGSYKFVNKNLAISIVATRVGNFRQKSNTTEDGIDEKNGLFRRNSGCSAEQ